MTDITATANGELMVAGLRAETDAGVYFVDAYVATDGKMTVPDSGWIVLTLDEATRAIADARQRGLVVEEVSQ